MGTLGRESAFEDAAAGSELGEGEGEGDVFADDVNEEEITCQSQEVQYCIQ